ncbi:hypothetical protein ACFPN2_28275 [Steroidobacter flavus]|uniref:Uncharacterized protein n=1 Tax=Steroidobacter flavus TaxID=1842136 RepID=A0ABV8T2A5_9GAMM
MTGPLSLEQRSAFYRAAVLGLHALDARESTARRFGPDAQTRWTQFAGALGAADRLDILLRDAAGTWGAAFSPAVCFDFFGLAEDEPFGPDWEGIDAVTAKRLLTEKNDASLEQVVSVLGVKPERVAVPPLTPSTKLVIAGGAAIVAVAEAFAADRALSWTDQVLVVAATPAFRQLAGLAAVLLGARARTVLVRPSGSAADLARPAGFAHLDAAVVSADAEAEAAEVAWKLSGK